MADKTVAQKAHVKPDATVAVLNEVPGVVASLGLPESVAFVAAPEATLLFLFVRDRAELDSLMPSAIDTLAKGAALWVFFRKGAKSAGLDMGRNDVWAIAEQHDMRPLGLVGVDDTWSAFRLRCAAGE